MRRILRLPATMAATGMGRSSIYAEVKAGTFPKPVKISAKAVGFVEDELAEYNAKKIAARDGGR